jgi:hypothetical protein
VTAEDILAEHDAKKPASKQPLTAEAVLAEHDGTAAPAAEIPGPYQGGENFDFAGSAKKTGQHVWDKYIAPEVIPTLASLAATKSPALTIAGRVGMLAAPAFETALQGVANYGGEKINQALGITPPDESNAVIRGVTSGATAGAGKAYSMVKPFLGRTGAVTANDLAATDANRMVQALTPRQGSEALFDQAMRSGATVPMNNTVGVLSTLLGRPKNGQSLSWSYGPAAAEMKAIQQEFQSGTTISPARWQFLHTRLGQAIGKMSKDGGKGTGEAKQLYGAMMTDLEQAANAGTTAQNTGVVSGGWNPLGPNQGGPGIVTPIPGTPRVGATPPTGINPPGIETGPSQPRLTDFQDVSSVQPPSTTVNPGRGPLPPNQPSPIAPSITSTAGQQGPSGNAGASTLLEALNTYRREKSVERLQSYVDKALVPLKGQGGDTQFNAAMVIKALNKDRFYEKAFTDVERRDIEKTLHVLNEAPNLPLHSSVNAGSKRVIERLTATAAAGALAGSTIGPMEGVAAAGAGFLLRDAADFSQNLSFALQTKSGRELIKELAKTKGGFFTSRNMSVLAGYASALRDQPDAEFAK